MPDMKGITVRIDAALHAEIKAYLEQHEMTMGAFIALAAQDELHPKIPEVEVKEVGRMRTLAFQVEEDLFQRVKQYLERNNMTQRQFVIGLIEEELDRDEELLRKQQEGVEQSEDGEAPVSEESPGNEYEDEQEEGPALDDSEDSLEEPDEEESEQDEFQELADKDLDTTEPEREFVEGELDAAVEVSPMPEFGEDTPPDFPEPDNEEEQDSGMSMGM